MTLRVRIAAAAGLAVALAVMAVAIAVYLGVRNELRDEVDVSLHQRADEVADFARNAGRDGAQTPGRRDRLPEIPPQPFGGPEGYVHLVRPDGRVLRRPSEGDALPLDARAREIARTGSGEDLIDTTVDGLHLRVFTRGLGSVGAIQVARPLDEVDRQLESILLVLLFVGAAGVALGVGLGAVVGPHGAGSDRPLHPPHRAAGRRPRPVRAHGGEWARRARPARAQLQHDAGLARALSGGAAAPGRRRQPRAANADLQSAREHPDPAGGPHRLPEQEVGSLQADIVEELDELTALVADIVELARGTKPSVLADDVRLDRIAEEIAERAQTRAGDRVRFQVNADPTVVRGEPQRIQRAVANLVDNAVKWSPPGGTVELELAGGELTVRDHGPGFAEADLPHVFERFYRAEGARGLPGSGLGLAIVRQAAEAHGGFATAGNAGGGGALLRVSFGAPVGAPSQPALS